MKKKIRTLFVTAAVLLSLIFPGCASDSPIQKSGFYFDTVITVTLYRSSYESLLDDCFALADRYEKLFSNTVADSDVSRINDAAGTPVTVSDETIELLQKGIAYGELSEGIFDITIGKLSKLWNISTKALLEETDASMVPSEEEITEALSTIDYHAIHIDGNEVILENANASIDLGGIAKGYIADKMKEYLVAHGVESGLINLGGNVLCIGEKPDKTAYNIGIQMPFSSDNETVAVVKITDQTVVSSGIYERYFMVDDRFYHHILDTSTGYPYDNGLLGVSVITGSSADGDALSTTCFSLGLEKGMELIEILPDTEAVFITDDYALHTSSGVGTTIPMES